MAAIAGPSDAPVDAPPAADDVNPRGGDGSIAAAVGPAPVRRAATLRRDEPDWPGTPARWGAIIPAYNEDKYISGVVLKTRRYVDRVVVVDDGSTDLTGV